MKPSLCEVYRTDGGLLEIVAPPGSGQLRATWTGRAAECDPKRTLRPFLRSLVAYATWHGATVELDCQRLQHVNSATIGCLVELVRECHRAAVPLVIRYDAARPWQRFAFDALRMVSQSGGCHFVGGAAAA